MIYNNYSPISCVKNMPNMSCYCRQCEIESRLNEYKMRIEHLEKIVEKLERKIDEN